MDTQTTERTEALLVFITIGNCKNDFQRIYEKSLNYLEQIFLKKSVNLVIQSGHFGVDCNELLERADKQIVKSFFSPEEFEFYAKNADIYIAHCGVGSILKRLAYGKKPLVLARNSLEHIDSHQEELYELLLNKSMITPLNDKLNVKNLSENITPIGICPPEINFSSNTVIAVSSVGGHKVALETLTSNLNHRVIQYVDEPFVGIENKGVRLFPSCGNKLMLPFRIIQAFLELRRFPNAEIYTTGAGVGLAFTIAGKILKRKVYIQESMTRVNKPSKWFSMASILADVKIVSPWAKFSGDVTFKIEKLN